MKSIKGNEIAEEILAKIKKEVTCSGKKPGLAVILVGDDPASKIYVDLKKKAAERVGVKFLFSKFSKNSSQSEIIERIRELNRDRSINGIIIQLPVPEKFDTQEIINSIDPKKDVDGFHPKNIEMFMSGESDLFPVFPKAIIKLIKSTKKDLPKRKAIIVSKSEKFGKIMKKTLEKEFIKAEYVLVNNLKKSLDSILQADIIVTACGVPKLVKNSLVKDGVIIVDGGIKKENKKVFGDVDIESFADSQSFISPVPGGVGPVTVACLLENVLIASKKQG